MMEQPILTTKDERVQNGNMNTAQRKEMQTHNRYTTILKSQEGWQFHGVGKTDTPATPWHFMLDDYPYSFIATQHKNIHGSEQITIFMCNPSFTYNLNKMAEVKTYISAVDLKSTIDGFVYDFESAIK